MRGDRTVVAQFGKDSPGQLFAQLHTPLVEREDIPDDPLHEDLVLVHGDQRAERTGSEQREEDGVGVVEVILILVVLISLVVIFKSQLTSLVNNILKKITSQSNSI